MRFISRNILTGLLTILPVVLTVYLLYWLAISSEAVLGGLIQLVLPEGMYWPGMGIVAGLIVVFVLGLLMRAYVVQSLFAMAERLLYRMPFIKSVYGAIRDFFNYFAPSTEKDYKQVVAVNIGDTDMQVIGFVTQAIPERLPEGFNEPDSILVYLPLSYMIGGYAVLIPRHKVRPLDMNMEEAMRFTLTAGVIGAPNSSSDSKAAKKKTEGQVKGK